MAEDPDERHGSPPGRPELVCAVDWSVAAEKRRVAVARLEGSRYSISTCPDSVPDVSRLLPGICEVIAPAGVALVGFDFPIGLPRAYAIRAGLRGFRTALGVLGTGRWARFFDPTDQPSIEQPFGPTSNPKGGLTRALLARAIGLPAEADLFRVCDQKTASRQRAEALFYTRFAKQVGRSAIIGWRDVLQPALSAIRLWPFDGQLAGLLGSPGVVVAEVYPAEAAGAFALPLGPGTGRSKTRKEDRAEAGPRLIAIAEDLGVTVAPGVASAVSDGLETEDQFDAFVALLAMLQVLCGGRPADPPEDLLVREVEGWILGQGAPLASVPRAERASLPDGPKSRVGRAAYFIKRVVCGRDAVFELAYPTHGNRGALNVICGPNDSGKSFVLDQIRRVVKGKSDAHALEVEPLPSGQPRILLLGKAWEAKDKIGLVNLEQTTNALTLPAKQGDYRRAGLHFLVPQLAPHLPSIPPSELNTRLADPKVREEVARTFPPGNKVYRCDEKHPLVPRLEQVLQGRLYFRCTKRDLAGGAWQFELVLLRHSLMTVPFGEWSDGQRAFFYVLAEIDNFQPEVVLFDEIENHLHPAFITATLEALRGFPAQYIIATHHPHLIFSRLVDRVFYMETRRPALESITSFRSHDYSGRHKDGPLQRDVTSLEDGFDRISAAYKLFDYQDDQLLRQAEYVEERTSLHLFDALSALFESAPKPASERPLPDKQTQMLADRLRAFSHCQGRETVRILDLGAGVGRAVTELGKLSTWQVGSRVQWTCYEPFEDARADLRQRLSSSGVAVIESLAEADGTFDFCLIANVLHELTPPHFAKWLIDADARVDHTRGGILILEMHPLLRTEGFAVPYEPLTLQRVLLLGGLGSDIAEVAVAGSAARAYCLLARRTDPTRPALRDQLAKAVEGAWAEILDLSLAAYALREPARDPQSYQRLLACLTTIASITAWRERRWAVRSPEAGQEGL